MREDVRDYEKMRNNSDNIHNSTDSHNVKKYIVKVYDINILILNMTLYSCECKFGLYFQLIFCVEFQTTEFLIILNKSEIQKLIIFQLKILFIN